MLNLLKSLAMSALKILISEKVLKKLLIYALEKYAEKNDNDLTHEVVKGVKEAIEPKSK